MNDLAAHLANKKQNLVHVSESEQHIVPEFYEEDDKPTELYPGLYIGSIKCARRANELSIEHGISHILTVCHEETPSGGENTTYHNFPIWDKQTEKLLPILQSTHECIDKIRENNEKVLVHCMGGISRSGSVCISYIMKEKKMPFLDIWREVKEKRSVIHPNEGFKEQLRIFEKSM